MWARLILVAAGSVTALFLARDAENFGVVQGMVAIALVAAVVVALALLRRRR
ncbi:hypothetical protein [Paracraurococcus ruber]|uniref:hypothetical protein n=1 Tax=Paracraurococcus ruber TaxID=77675 RepID=UPI001863A006|nr:hypothetical protein [Paracraurococcus ruber]